MKWIKILLMLMPAALFGQVDFEKVCISYEGDTLSGWQQKIDKLSNIYDLQFNLLTGAVAIDSRYCEVKCTNCYVSKNAYWLVDNTGTRFSENMTFLITYDNGDVMLVYQNATGGWSAQLLEWQDNTFQDGTSKCIEQGACNRPGGCGGLPGVPTEITEAGVDVSAMFVRYLNVTCCYDQRIPVKIEVVDSDNPRYIGRKLPLINFYGEAKKYQVCERCGEEPEIRFWDTGEKVPDSEMPICLEPCGFIYPPLASPTCTFTYFDGCDQNADPVKAIKIEYVDCGEGSVTNAIFSIEADGSLELYEPVLIDSNGDGEATASIDDCQGGTVPDVLPELDCNVYDLEYATACSIINGVQCEIVKEIKYCDGVEIIRYYDETNALLGVENKDGSYTPPALTKCEDDCCTYYVNSNRNGISNTAFYSNFEWGTVTGNSWDDFVASYQFQGGRIYEYCPDVACNVKSIRLCGLTYNSSLTYTDENGDRQVLTSTCTPAVGVTVTSVLSSCQGEEPVLIQNYTDGSTQIIPAPATLDNWCVCETQECVVQNDAGEGDSFIVNCILGCDIGDTVTIYNTNGSVSCTGVITGIGIGIDETKLAIDGCSVTTGQTVSCN